MECRNDRLYEKLDEYYNTFGDVFPMMEYDLPINKAIKFIDKCLKSNKEAQEFVPINYYDDINY